MLAVFGRVTGRNVKQFSFGQSVYVFCDRDKTPQQLQHLVNTYQPAIVAGFIRKDSVDGKLAVRLPEGSVFNVDPATYEVLMKQEFDCPAHKNVRCAFGSKALRRSREFSQPPRPLPVNEYPALMTGDDVVIFCPSTHDVTADTEIIPRELVNTFLTGKIVNFNGTTLAVYTGEKHYTIGDNESRCLHPILVRSPLQASPVVIKRETVSASYDINYDNPLVIWRGDYERLRRWTREQPKLIEQWLDYFEFPLKYTDIEIGRELFAESLKKSFSYILPIKYYL